VTEREDDEAEHGEERGVEVQSGLAVHRSTMVEDAADTQISIGE